MEKSLNELLADFRDTLAKMSKNLGELLELENQKYEALKSVDIKSLMDLNSSEEELIQYSDTLEKKRVRIIGKLAANLGFDVNLKLSEMLTYFPVSYQQEFTALRNEIKGRSDHLQITMRENAEIVQANLDIVNFTLNFATGTNRKDTYCQSGHSDDKNNLYLIDRMA